MWRWILIAILFLSLSACSAIRKDIKLVVDEDVKNYNASIHISKELLKTWRLNSGFIRGSLGDKINQFPVEVKRAMDELDALAIKPNPDDYDLGYSLGARLRLMGAMITNVLKQYAPDVLKYLPIGL